MKHVQAIIYNLSLNMQIKFPKQNIVYVGGDKNFDKT